MLQNEWRITNNCSVKLVVPKRLFKKNWRASNNWGRRRCIQLSDEEASTTSYAWKQSLWNHPSCLSAISAWVHLVSDNGTDMYKHAENTGRMESVVKIFSFLVLVNRMCECQVCWAAINKCMLLFFLLLMSVEIFWCLCECVSAVAVPSCSV